MTSSLLIWHHRCSSAPSAHWAP